VAINSQITAQSDDEGTGLLGDNFSLEGALDVFKNATSLENFEELLNNEDKAINNLDLNDDGDIDYIRVEDHMEGDVHAIILQAVISEDESQDVAVIEIEKTDSESATLQIVGDEYLYGEDIYVEPFEEEASSDGKGGPSADYTMSRIVVNVWGWPSVRFIYRPNYVVYRSPFRWKVYPRAWKPWRPLTWHVYHGKRYHYHRHYRHVNTHRVVRARKIYTPKRRSSKVVVKKSKTVTKVGKNKNGNTVVKKSTKTTKVKKGKNGKVAGKKTTKTKKVKKGKKGKKVTRTKKVKKKGGK
jgi:hypothetical protein